MNALKSDDDDPSVTNDDSPGDLRVLFVKAQMADVAPKLQLSLTYVSILWILTLILKANRSNCYSVADFLVSVVFKNQYLIPSIFMLRFTLLSAMISSGQSRVPVYIWYKLIESWNTKWSTEYDSSDENPVCASPLHRPTTLTLFSPFAAASFVWAVHWRSPINDRKPGLSWAYWSQQSGYIGTKVLQMRAAGIGYTTFGRLFT